MQVTLTFVFSEGARRVAVHHHEMLRYERLAFSFLLAIAPAPAPAALLKTGAGKACAQMDGIQSNIWSDASTGFRTNFDLHVQFPLAQDDDYMEKTVKIEWSRPLSIEHVQPQGAATAIRGGENWIEIEVTPQYIGHTYFSIQGFRQGGTSSEDLLVPIITCNGGTDVPPPSPPGVTSCDLAPKYGAYPIGGTRESGSDVTIKLTDWKPFRVFTMIYYGQEGLLVQKPQGATILDQPQVVGPKQIGFTFSLTPDPSDGERCEGHPACIEFELKPQPHHHPHIICLESPPPSPPSPPPPPPPVIRSPPPPPALGMLARSPPPPVAVAAGPECPLGAVVHLAAGSPSTTPAGLQSVRLVVIVESWVKGRTVTISTIGDGVTIKHVVHATLATGGGGAAPSGQPDTASFTFTLQEEPIEMSAFAVVAEARHWGGIAFVSCAAARASPPPALATKATSSEYYSYGEGHDGQHGVENSYEPPLVGDASSGAQGLGSSNGGGGTRMLLLVVVVGALVGAGVLHRKGMLNADGFRQLLKGSSTEYERRRIAGIESIPSASVSATELNAAATLASSLNRDLDAIDEMEAAGDEEGHGQQ